jgi:hypothetical protein
MSEQFYVGLNEACAALAKINVHLTEAQMRRAAVSNGGKRKLPFFVDPVDRKLKIDLNTLLGIYTHHQVGAENAAEINPASIRKSFEKLPRYEL